MCGILYVRGRVAWDQHQEAMQILNSRGPDFTRYWQHNDTFIAHSVLHITGGRKFYQNASKDFLAYNGEIYNYRSFGNYDNDIELIDHAVKNNRSMFKSFTGPYAWVWTNGSSYAYASDPQGERCLYRYQDDSILIVCSEVAPILKYRNLNLCIENHSERHWPVHARTPWRSIERVPPGIMFDQDGVATKLDSIFDWCSQEKYSTLADAAMTFDDVLNSVMQDMTPREPAALTFSGGLDTACLLAKIPNAELYTTNVSGKDLVSTHVQEFLTPNQRQNLHVLDIDEKTWAQDYIDVVQRTRMPVQSWSFVGQWHIAKHCEQRILFSGVGADELFGGYGVYQTLDYKTNYSASPYSYFDPDSADIEVLENWQRCLNFYHGDARQATLMMDYITQISGVDLRGVDVCTAAHGIEPRAPFCHPKIIKFALNLPWEYKVGLFGKPVIRSQFLREWDESLIFDKQGFAGHCNDSYPWLGISVQRQQDRMSDWRVINQAAFTRWASAVDQTTGV